jgi:hypothetical protein
MAEIISETQSAGELNVRCRFGDIVRVLHFARVPDAAAKAAAIAAMEAQIPIDAKTAEIDANMASIISGEGSLVFSLSTPAENATELRRRFRRASGIDAARIAKWVYQNLTVAQIKALWNLTDEQVAALREKLLALRDHLAAVETAEGE